uniref:Uncharacterized protein n=1 Tax=Oryza barthii TaxID=65489 RepID=A0A0D3H2M0_9ORYZ
MVERRREVSAGLGAEGHAMRWRAAGSREEARQRGPRSSSVPAVEKGPKSAPAWEKHDLATSPARTRRSAGSGARRWGRRRTATAAPARTRRSGGSGEQEERARRTGAAAPARTRRSGGSGESLLRGRGEE